MLLCRYISFWSSLVLVKYFGWGFSVEAPREDGESEGPGQGKDSIFPSGPSQDYTVCVVPDPLEGGTGRRGAGRA